MLLRSSDQEYASTLISSARPSRLGD